ncbi:MAG: HAD family hydrolase, partial [Bdellovibrionota bacterium]
AETLARLLTGAEPWPLVLRLSPKLPGAARGHRVIPNADPGALWQALVELTETVPASVAFAVLIQPELQGETRGTAPHQEAPALVRAFLEKGRGLLGVDAELDWTWDGETLWFTALRPSRVLLAPVRQLLVDLDGTLLLARDLPLRASFMRSAYAKIRRHGGWLGGLRGLRALLSERKEGGVETNRARTTALFAEALRVNTAKAEEILEEAVLSHFPKLRPHFYAAPGALDFLEWAKTRFPMVLATNPVWPEPIVNLRVDWAGVAPGTFRSVTHSDRMHACKPSGDYYRELLAQEGFEAGSSLLIGDHLKMDLPATRVGIPVFIVHRGGKSPVKSLTGRSAPAPAWSGNFLQLQAVLDSAMRPAIPIANT